MHSSTENKIKLDIQRVQSTR